MAYESPNAQLNKMVESMLQYQMQKKLIDRRNTGEMQQIYAQKAGSQELEGLRHKNDLAKMKANFAYQISMLEPIKAINSRINLARMNGEDTAALEELRRSETSKQLGFMYERMLGQDVTKTSLASALESLTEETVRAMALSAEETTRQGRQLKSTAVTQGLTASGQELEKSSQALTARGLELRGKELEASNKPGGSDYYKSIHSKTTALIGYLSKLQSGEATGGGTISLGPDGKLMVSSGEVGGAGLDTKGLMSIISKVSHLDSVAMDRPLSQQEMAFIDNAWNTYGIKGKQDELAQKLIQRGVPEADAQRIAAQTILGQ